MCFSTSASFGAGIVLSVLGVATLRKVREPRQYPFAAIPLFFGVQQLLEGVIWLSFSRPDYREYQQAATYAYLVFAQAVWPVWVPFSIFLLEKNDRRKQLLALLTVGGVVAAAMLLYFVFSQHATAGIEGNHIKYGIDTPPHFWIWTGSLYLLATVVSPVVSTVRRMQWLGLVSLASFLVSKIYFEDNFISVWCFFAAILSVSVFMVMQAMRVSGRHVSS